MAADAAISRAMFKRPTAAQARHAAIASWLMAVAVLVFAMIVVGGITRLTESGLSMVRWDPVSGIVPPLDAEQWEAEFDAYRTSPQYQIVNSGMTIEEFKTIFFWEYVHRLLGRVIGLAFALPLLWFWWKRAIPGGYGWKLVGLLVLGGMQGAIGWWMVTSGLADRPEVSHIRLAVHLLLALSIFGLLIWVALDLRTAAGNATGRPARIPVIACWTLSLLFLQLLFGAYVAGLEAGYAFNSWPKMGDEWYPTAAPMLEPMLRNFVDNPIMVQFVHRWLAFAVAAVAGVLAYFAWRRGAKRTAAAVVAALVVQILLGILTLRSGVEINVAVAHQGMAALLLATIVTASHRLGERREASRA
jgi:cytochrome c oxidase assembly protein subunit 15